MIISTLNVGTALRTSYLDTYSIFIILNLFPRTEEEKDLYNVASNFLHNIGFGDNNSTFYFLSSVPGSAYAIKHNSQSLFLLVLISVNYSKRNLPTWSFRNS